MSDLSISQNLAHIQKRIKIACEEANRPLKNVSLVAVSKFHPLSSIESALKAGQKIFGENRIQEACEKFSGLRPRYPGLRLHLTCPVQSNKALTACQIADVIETLDRPSLCQALQKAAEKTGHLPDLLIQINIGREINKSGIMPEKADDFIDQAQSLFGDKVKGLMCIPPQDENPLPYFKQLGKTAEKHGLKTLSMGMSADFETAIEAGATLVRIGTAIFGGRPSV